METGPRRVTVLDVDAAFLSPRDAAAVGIPKSTAHRVKDSLAASVQGQILVIDGAPITSGDALLEFLSGLAARAQAAESALGRETEARRDVEADLLVARAELEETSGKLSQFTPALVEIANLSTQLLRSTTTPRTHQQDQR
jgi:hypothetical protein